MAEVKVLLKGYLGDGSCSTVSLVRDVLETGEQMVMVVDPGTVKSQNLIVEALKSEGLASEDVTHVGITHGHMDHFRNIGMFGMAKAVDYWGIWSGDDCVSSDKEDMVKISGGVKTVKTPGHSYDSITFLVFTSEGEVAICGDVFWKKDYPKVEDDPYASDRAELVKSRTKVLEIADAVIPGHGEKYTI